MSSITDEYMREMISKTKNYTIVLLKPGPGMMQDNVKKIIWEHGRRNFELRADEKVAIVCPIGAEADINGLYIFNTGVEETQKIMEGDPAVMAGIFVYTAYPCRSFPGDALGQ